MLAGRKERLVFDTDVLGLSAIDPFRQDFSFFRREFVKSISRLEPRETLRSCLTVLLFLQDRVGFDHLLELDFLDPWIQSCPLFVEDGRIENKLSRIGSSCGRILFDRVFQEKANLCLELLPSQKKGLFTLLISFPINRLPSLQTHLYFDAVLDSESHLWMTSYWVREESLGAEETPLSQVFPNQPFNERKKNPAFLVCRLVMSLSKRPATSLPFLI